MPGCPVDRTDMRAITLAGGATEYLCTRCDGLWLPGKVVHATLGAMPLERIRNTGTTRSLRCPNDGTHLQALHHHGVEIDICTHCTGVWLDAGERDKILETRNPSSRIKEHVQDLCSEAINAIDPVETTSDIGSAILEFIGDALSSL